MPTLHVLKLLASLAVAAASLLAESVAHGETSQTAAPSTAPTEAAAAVSTPELMREGGKILDEVGYFRLTGDRATFFFREGKRQLSTLENLALERVAQVVGESSETLSWSVSGTLTEYRGHNYLLITRAVIKRAAPAAGTQARK